MTFKYQEEIKLTENDLKDRGLINPKNRLPYNPKLTTRAKMLRKNMTRAEKEIWYKCFRKLKYRILRQRPIDNYIIDFYCPKLRLAIEIDGSIHNKVSVKEYDAKRTKDLEMYRIRVIRFLNEEVLNNIDVVCNKVRDLML